MRKLTIIALSSILFLGLSGCGAIIGAVVGNVDVGDPLQLDGRSVPITTQRLDSTAIGSLASGGTVAFDDVEIDDVEIEDLPLGINVSRLRNELSIEPTVRVSRPLDGFPDSFTIRNISLALTISDINDSVGVTTGEFSAPAGSFNIDPNCDVASALECNYDYDDATPGPGLDQALFVIVVSGQDVRDLVNIIRIDGPNTPNTLAGTLSFEAESTPELAGGIVEITLRSLEANVRVSSN